MLKLKFHYEISGQGFLVPFSGSQVKNLPIS